jgi:hypothetical protein
MTEHDIRNAESRQLRDRLAYLRTETTEYRSQYGTAALARLRAEREAIVAEIDYRRAEDAHEAYVARMAAGGGLWS